MTTNPTPLTAEDVLKDIYRACAYGDSHGKSAVEWLEAYAAQQNAELVAENSRLMNESMDARIKIDSLLFTNKNLQAENERLKQQLENTALLYERFRQAIDMGEMPVGWVDMDAEVEEVLGRGLKL